MVARREGRGGAGEGGGAGHRPAARTSSRVRHSLGRPGSGGHQTQQGAAPHVTRCGTPSLGTRDCVASNVKCNLKHCFLEVSNANVTAARADPVFQTKPRPPYLTPPVQGAAKPVTRNGGARPGRVCGVAHGVRGYRPGFLRPLCSVTFSV